MSDASIDAEHPLLAAPETLARARRIIALAYERGHITAHERGVFEHNLEESPAVDTPPLSLVRSIVKDLWLLVEPSTNLASAAQKFLRSTPPTRGGVFLEMDAAEASPAPRATSADVVATRQLVDQAFALTIITARECTMLLAELAGADVTQAAVDSVRKMLDARGRSASRFGARK